MYAIKLVSLKLLKGKGSTVFFNVSEKYWILQFWNRRKILTNAKINLGKTWLCFDLKSVHKMEPKESL